MSAEGAAYCVVFVKGYLAELETEQGFEAFRNINPLIRQAMFAASLILENMLNAWKRHE